MLILIISLAAMPAGGTPYQPSTNTCCAISQTLQACEKACAFPPQPGEGTVHPIAHQVKPAAGCGAAPEAMGLLK